MCTAAVLQRQPLRRICETADKISRTSAESSTPYARLRLYRVITLRAGGIRGKADSGHLGPGMIAAPPRLDLPDQ